MTTDNETKGIIFDIQRCSMYDGPGIRTTVFLKGCPLSCKWCHNPESQKSSAQLALYHEKCTGCQTCADIHPEVHRILPHVSGSFEHIFSEENCSHCGKCVQSCPASALKLFGQSVSVDQVLDIVKKDISFYKETGGGLTISGGEPFYQFPFLLSLAKAAHQAGISVCVETCGFFTRNKLDEIMPYIDVFLFDYKETSSKLHKSYTGVENTIILDNLDYIYQNRKKIILRCPVIPGYNDSKEHFTGIAHMEKIYPHLYGIEIMPYHDMGKTKARAIGAKYQISAPTADSSKKMEWKQKMTECGCSAKVTESF